MPQSGWTGRSARSKAVDGDGWAPARQRGEVVRVGGQHHTATGSGADGDDGGIDVVGRPSGGSHQEVADSPGHGPVSGGDSNSALASQARVHGLIVTTTTVELGKHCGRDDDLSNLNQRRGDGGPNGAFVRPAPSQG